MQAMRSNRMVIRAEADKSVKSQTPSVDRSKPENIEAGNISNENAEKRADIGKDRAPTPTGTAMQPAPLLCHCSEVKLMRASPSNFERQPAHACTCRPQLSTTWVILAEAQAFDGPAPETINGRLAMLGVATCIGAEFATNVGIQEQIQKAPLSILGTFVLISLASYVPILRQALLHSVAPVLFMPAAATAVRRCLTSLLS